MSTDPATQAEAQLRRIEQTLGRTAADVAQEIKRHGIDRHSDVVAFLKSTHGLTHGNANLMAHVARQLLAGGPAAPEDLLAAQYAGPKATLLPLYEKLSALAEALGPDVVKVVQKTGVSFRRKKQFALIQAASAIRLRLGLNLDDTPSDPRIVESRGMCTHTVDFTTTDAVDDAVASWLTTAYTRAA